MPLQSFAIAQPFAPRDAALHSGQCARSGLSFLNQPRLSDAGNLFPHSQQTGIAMLPSHEKPAAHERAGEMIDAGLIAEVDGLRPGGLSRTAAQALGYKEILEALDGRISQDEAIEMIISRTRRFAVRQERWFRRDPRVRWIDVEHDPVAEAAPAVIDAFDT